MFRQLPIKLAIQVIGVLGAGTVGVSMVNAAAISQVPLHAGIQVQPNIMLIIDDSGSMDSEVLFPSNDGALWWNTTDRRFVGRDKDDNQVTGVVNYNNAGEATGTWKKYVYLFPNGTGTGARVYADAGNDHYAIPPLAPYAFARSADYNGMYYDYNETYAPWHSGGTASFTDASPSAASSDPVYGSGTLDLLNELETDSGNWTFRMHAGMVIPAGTDYEDGNGWGTATADTTLSSTRDIGIRYYPATYFTKTSTGSYSINGSSGACDQPNPAHYLDFIAAPSGFVSSAVDALAPDGGCLVRHEIRSGNSFPSGRSYEDEAQNFANWFTYYRKRHLALRGSAGHAFSNLDFLRAGGFRINSRSLNGMWDFGETAEKTSFYNFLYNAVGSGGTPNRQALDYAGEQFDTNSSVIEYSCQKNFALLFTDGFSNPDNVGGIGNADGDKGEPYADSYSSTIADVAMYYYDRVLRSALDSGNVPIPGQCGADAAPAWLDCNTHLHMVTYGITLGAQGELFGVTHEDIEDAYLDPGPPTWQEPDTQRNPVQVDDLYHATINGRGEMMTAATATDLQQTISAAVNSILLRSASSSASVASNSTRINADTLIYQAKFDTSDWSGRLVAYQIEADGTVSDPDADGNIDEHAVWDTDHSGTIPAAGSRAIYTRIDGVGVAFNWASLTTEQQASLTGLGLNQTIVDWVRGEQTTERPTGTLRWRKRLLGDIVNSNPAYAGGADFGYGSMLCGDTTYSAFLTTKASRPKMLYVGANDGMLHAFDAETGLERFSFIPSELLSALPALAEPDYAHRYYVDGSPQIADACIDGAWRTLLIGSLGAGGRSLFALDVSDPEHFDANDILWEFSDDALGYPVNQFIHVSAGLLRSDDWVLIAGNGYGSLNDTAALLIVNLATGERLALLDTEVGSASDPNGLAGTVLVPNIDRKIVTVYAGDLHGNLWKFDLDASNPNSWGIAFKSGNTPEPLFTASYPSNGVSLRQPITAPPEVVLHPDSGHLVLFGTGQYFQIGDNATTDVQSLYGIWDNGDTVTRSQLEPQAILAEVTRNGHNWRITSGNTVDWDTGTGWLMDLISPASGAEGERIVSSALIRHGRVVFTSVVPSVEPCEAGGTSWITELNMLTGAQWQASVFDVNDDGAIDDDDLLALDSDGDGQVEDPVPASGIESDVGIINSPAVISAGPVEYKYTAGSTGGLMRVFEAGDATAGRQSWRQIR